MFSKMAETLPSAIEQELLGIKNLLWGNEIKHDIFKRWSQGNNKVSSYFTIDVTFKMFFRFLF